MSYTIKIKQVREVRRNIGAKWERVGTNPDNTPQYGYTPEIETFVTQEVEIYEQTVDSLNIADVVSVVNGLAKK